MQLKKSFSKKHSKKHSRKNKRKSTESRKSRKSIKGGNFVMQQQPQPFSIQKPNVSMLSQQFTSARCQSQIRAYKINPRAGITTECKKYITK